MEWARDEEFGGHGNIKKHNCPIMSTTEGVRGARRAKWASPRLVPVSLRVNTKGCSSKNKAEVAFAPHCLSQGPRALGHSSKHKRERE